MKYKVSSDYASAGPPKWSDSGNVLLIPKNIEQRTKDVFAKEAGTDARRRHAERMIERSKDKLSSRLGWFTRTHPLELPSGRILLPMYSDGFSFSVIGISDDGGSTWTASEPIVGYGNIQPSLVRRKDGTLVAYMRDNGPAPKRIHASVSHDDGMTWTPAVDTDFSNPGSSVEAISLRDGSWLIVYNDLESGRRSLAISLSDDEGRTWKWTRHLEFDGERKNASFHYPSVMQARDGSVHVTYSYFLNHLPADAPRKAIKHARFNAAWVKQGDAKTLAE
jgi:predicted neuraminidase